MKKFWKSKKKRDFSDFLKKFLRTSFSHFRQVEMGFEKNEFFLFTSNREIYSYEFNAQKQRSTCPTTSYQIQGGVPRFFPNETEIEFHTISYFR